MEFVGLSENQSPVVFHLFKMYEGRSRLALIRTDVDLGKCQWSALVSVAHCCFSHFDSGREHREKETRRQVELSNPVLSSAPTPGPLQLIYHRHKALAL